MAPARAGRANRPVGAKTGTTNSPGARGPRRTRHPPCSIAVAKGAPVSVEAMIEVIERAAQDPEFRGELRTNPDAVLLNFDLTPAEMAALKAGNRRALRALGLPDEFDGRPMVLWRGKDEAGSPGNTLNPQRVSRPSTTEAGVAPRRR